MAEKLKPRIYTVAPLTLTPHGTGHETFIKEYIPKTLKENFKLFEKYPEYKFSFEGSYRYELIKSTTRGF